jgi:hypothetical protein
MHPGLSKALVCSRCFVCVIDYARNDDRRGAILEEIDFLSKTLIVSL